MQKIDNNIKINLYGQEGMINKYIFFERDINEYHMYYICKIDKILDKRIYPKYECSLAYMLSVPKNDKIKCYVYDNINIIQLISSDILYELTRDEWINLFRKFVKYEAQYFNDINEKIL